MTGLASRGQLRMSFGRTALVIVPFVLLLGYLSGWISGSSRENEWYEALAKPGFNPPGAAFGIVWPILYVLIGTALTVIVFARGARGRGLAIALFTVQLALNLAWSPLFFAAHRVWPAFWLSLAILAAATATTVLFRRIRPVAAWLMLPYLAWLSFAAVLNYEIGRLNPNADRATPGATTSIRLSGIRL